MDSASEAFLQIREKFPNEAQYLVTHGSFTNFYIKLNLRALAHMIELRSTPQGHPSYRYVAQEMGKLVAAKFPLFAENIFKFVSNIT